MSSYLALIVDDEPVIRQASARAFRTAGFLCDLANDGRTALELARDRRYDLVVTDLQMPEINGHQLSLEFLGQANRPVLIVVTGVLEERLERDLRARGVDEVFFKPVDYSIVASQAISLVETRAVENRGKRQAGQALPGQPVAAANDQDSSASTEVAANVPEQQIGTRPSQRPSASPDPEQKGDAAAATISDGKMSPSSIDGSVIAAQPKRVDDAGVRHPKRQIAQMQSARDASPTGDSGWVIPILAFACGMGVGWLLSIIMR